MAPGGIAAAPSSESQETQLQVKKVPLMIGKTKVAIKQHYGPPGSLNVFVNIHDNENTAAAAAKEVVKKQGGVLIELCAQGKHYVTFKIGSSLIKFDPNEIFSDDGINKRLDRSGMLSAKVRAEAFDALAGFRENLLRIIQGAFYPSEIKTIIAVHNDFTGIGHYEKEGKESTVRKEKSKLDFFFVTKNEDYDRLKNGYNVILQKDAYDDNGSLSQWCARNGVRYLNVEAGKGRLSEQAGMIKEAIRIEAVGK